MTQPKTASKFTPGPWHLRSKTSPMFEVWGCDTHIAQVARAPFPPYPNVGETEPNARLIAKAPEMYELLTYILDENKTIHNRLSAMDVLVSLGNQARRLKAEIDGE